ncbi:MAG TPA: hypothetical protein VG796_00160 [Verrucomicrobiales bacterium]|nr:hypothetical protein [Verrucomicrobiales bacterium]
MLRLFVSLILVLCFSSCGSTRESEPAGQPPAAAVKSRLRGPVALVLMGLQDQLALQRPTQHAAVWKDSGGDAIEGFKGMGGAGQAAVLLLPLWLSIR